ncbi:type II toxin-antitoxin system PemK/MazF family toxin [Adlercreutzia muris]|uniref:type II toxin-antitoxin system PemK/MazF family toxin n=1 Tax=Adlercreutzia muris TaxID=1796610 RepID=UPI003B969BA4
MAATRRRLVPLWLFKTSYVMADKIISVDKALLGERIGVLADEDMELVGRSLARVLGLG